MASALLLAAFAWRGRIDLYVWTAAFIGIFAAAMTRPTQGAHPRVANTPAAPAAGPRAAELIQRFPDPVILLDTRAAVVAANPPARALMPSLELRQPLSLVLRAPEVLDNIARVLATGEPADVEMEGRSAADPTYEVRLRPLSAPTPAEAAAALFFRDLTTERRIETMSVDFVANVSHELRTPLASLIGFIDTLQGPARDDPAARERFLGVMRAQAARMARLIDDLLHLSRLELHAHVAPSQSLELSALLADTVAILAPLARERGVEVVLDLGRTPALVMGERDEMIRMVENLIENAIKYGGAGGRVEVALSRGFEDGPPRVELSVRDQGPGIAPEHLPRLTERFYRVDTAVSRNQGGTGLGLAIVKHIVGRHRGRLAIESSVGAGTLVRITLPEHVPDTASSAGAQRSE